MGASLRGRRGRAVSVAVSWSEATLVESAQFPSPVGAIESPDFGTAVVQFADCLKIVNKVHMNIKVAIEA